MLALSPSIFSAALALLTAVVAQGKSPLPSAQQAPLTDVELRAFLDRWVSTQNRGDFAGYAHLYAPRFHGVRRSGPRVVSLDQKGWLKDRERMFNRTMTVGVSKLQVKARGGRGELRFEQSWASGNYRDIGPKEMVVMRGSDGELVITREHLLFSQLGPTAEGPGLLARPEWILVLDGMLVLADGDSDLCQQEDKLIFSCTMPTNKVPPKIASWRGQHVTVHAPGKAPCEARIDSFAVVTGVKGDDRNYDPWEMGQKLLVAELDRRCEGSWAHLTNLKPEVLRTLAALDVPPARTRRLTNWLDYSRAADNDDDGIPDGPEHTVASMQEWQAKGGRLAIVLVTTATSVTHTQTNWHADDPKATEKVTTTTYSLQILEASAKRPPKYLGSFSGYATVRAFLETGKDTLPLILLDIEEDSRDRTLVLLGPDTTGAYRINAQVRYAIYVEPPGC
jgi:hypothetical protein